jgi:Tfp pilus assembly protein PilX
MNRTLLPSTCSPPGRDQRGVAMLFALMVLGSLGILTMFLVASGAVNRRMGSDDVTKLKALRYAEAGVFEAMARIQRGEGPDIDDLGAPRQVVQVLNASAVGAAGADTTLLATGQPNGDWLPYTTATKGVGALTIEFKTDPARTLIYRYDKTANPPVQFSTGRPIYRVTATGTVGTVTRTVVTEVVWNTIQFDIRGALASNQGVDFSGSGVACGYNHRGDTPTGTGALSRLGGGGCAENLLAVPPRWEWTTGSIPGMWSTGAASSAGNAFGAPAMSGSNPSFYAGPWEVVGMTKAEFFSWVGPPVAALPSNPNGIYYLDNDATQQNATGHWADKTGSGFLYADGDLDLHSNWRGVIYAEGNLKINGNAWILGAVINKGSAPIQFNGNATILYSRESLTEHVAKAGIGKFATLSWRE